MSYVWVSLTLSKIHKTRSHSSYAKGLCQNFSCWTACRGSFSMYSKTPDQKGSVFCVLEPKPYSVYHLLAVARRTSWEHMPLELLSCLTLTLSNQMNSLWRGSQDGRKQAAKRHTFQINRRSVPNNLCCTYCTVYAYGFALLSRGLAGRQAGGVKNAGEDWSIIVSLCVSECLPPE